MTRAGAAAPGVVGADDRVEVETIGGRQAAHVFEPSRPAGAREDPPVTVGLLPALGIGARYYAGLAQALRARGLRVVLADLPGHGDSPVRPRRGVGWGYRELVCVHLPAVHAAARARDPATPFVWVGHSLGGQLALLHAGATARDEPAPPGPDAGGPEVTASPGPVAGVALVASGSPWYRAWSGPRAAALLAATQACGALALALGSYPGHRVGFGGHEAAPLIREWARVGRTGAYHFPGLDGEALLARWRGPTLAVPLAGDALAPRPAMAHTLDKTGAAVTWAPWADPAGPLDHNRWPRTPEPAAERVATWLRSAVLPGAPTG